MSRAPAVLSFAMGAWALASVIRAIGLADGIAAAGAPEASLGRELALWILPVLAAAAAAVVAVSLPSAEVDPYIARNVRMGAMVATFAVLLAWSLVLVASYVGTLVPS